MQGGFGEVKSWGTGGQGGGEGDVGVILLQLGGGVEGAGGHDGLVW